MICTQFNNHASRTMAVGGVNASHSLGLDIAFGIYSVYYSRAMSDRNAALRALIEHRFPDATPVTHRTAEPVATGISALDGILPGHGLPRGRLTVWMPEGGATAILRATSQTTVLNGERAVWIDGKGTIAGAFWEEGPVL